MALTKVNIVGITYMHTYLLDGEFYYKECTKEEYEALGERDASQPKLPVGAKWVNSQGGVKKFDSASGLLENGQYAVLENVALVKLPNAPMVPVEKESIVNDTLDQKTTTQINEYAARIKNT